jgi:hypothetical protein
MTLYISISNMFWMSNIPISSEPTLAVKAGYCSLVAVPLSCGCPAVVQCTIMRCTAKNIKLMLG